MWNDWDEIRRKEESYKKIGKEDLKWGVGGEWSEESIRKKKCGGDGERKIEEKEL